MKISDVKISDNWRPSCYLASARVHFTRQVSYLAQKGSRRESSTYLGVSCSSPWKETADVSRVGRYITGSS